MRKYSLDLNHYGEFPKVNYILKIDPINFTCNSYPNE